MTDSSDLEDLTDPRPLAFDQCVVPDRLIEKLEVLVDQILARAHAHQDPILHEVRHKLWLMTRVLRHDEELSFDDIDV